MHRDDLRRLGIVADHLGFLRDDWDGSMTDGSLTRSSTVLRILLVQMEYRKAWHFAGFDGEPKVDAAVVGSGDSVVWSQAGGAEFGGVTTWGVTVHNRVMGDEEIKANYEQFKQQPPAETLSISKYVKSPSIVQSGQIITRGDVINYVANKLGGAHIDNTDRSKEAASFAVLDDFMSHLQLADKRSPYYELLSIGQAVGRSPDANRLIRRAGELGASV